MVSAMVKVYVDERERNSKVPKYLISMGVSVVFKQLDVGDYIPAEGYVIERKRVDDLAHSVFEGRFFHQIKRLKESGLSPILLIEGNLSILEKITSKPKAVEAALITAAIYNNIPIIYTRNARHSAEVIKYIAEKLQSHEVRHVVQVSYRKYSKPKDQLDFRAWQVYILSSFPGIGPKTAEKLLNKFGSLRNVLNASPSELARVEGMSEDKAWLINKILNYESREVRESKGLTKFMRGQEEA